MFESDADRLALIRALGGVVFSTAKGDLEAIMEEGYAEAGLDSLGAEGTAPYLQSCSIDVERLGLAKGVQITRGSRVLKVQRLEPDGTGMTRVVVTG